MRQNQHITAQQQDMVKPFIAEKRATRRENQREQQNLEKERIVGEQHRKAALQNGGKGSIFLKTYQHLQITPQKCVFSPRIL